MPEPPVRLYPSNRQNGPSWQQRYSNNIHHPTIITIFNRFNKSIIDVINSCTRGSDQIVTRVFEESEERLSQENT